MKHLTRGQMRVVIVLNLMIVALLCGLLFRYPLGETNFSGSPNVNEHNIHRNARISLNINLDFESNYGGSGQEEIVSAFASPDQTQIHIFGNTTSSDLDFSEKNGAIFYIIADKKAKIENIFTFGENGDILRKVIIAEGGYLLAIDNQESKTVHLLHVALNGDLINKLTHPTVSDEYVADLILMENCYMLVLQYGVTNTNFFDIKVILYTLDFKDGGTAMIHNASYSQEYVAVLPKSLDKYVMAVNYKSELWNGMSIIEFTIGSNSYTKIQLENNYEAKGFMPITGGYVALIIDSEKRSSLISLSNNNYTLKEKKYLSTYSVDGRLFFANSKYYAHVRSEDSSSVFYFNAELGGGEEIIALKDVGSVYYSFVRSGAVLFACGGQSASMVALSETSSNKYPFGSDGKELNSILVFLENDIFIICQSDEKGGDVGDNFGGSDIWIAKISQ